VMLRITVYFAKSLRDTFEMSLLRRSQVPNSTYSSWHDSKVLVCFLFAFCSYYSCIFRHLWDIQHQRMAWPWKLG